MVIMLGGAWSAEARQRTQESALVGSDRPEPRELRLEEGDVLQRFTADVRADKTLRERALALWRTHFAAQADELRARFLRESDWRPAFAEAAELVDEFLEASLLPRQGSWSAGEGTVWIETLDRTSGQRKRELQRKAERPFPLLAPQGDKAGGKSPAAPGRALPRK